MHIYVRIAKSQGSQTVQKTVVTGALSTRRYIRDARVLSQWGEENLFTTKSKEFKSVFLNEQASSSYNKKH